MVLPCEIPVLLQKGVEALRAASLLKPILTSTFQLHEFIKGTLDADNGEHYSKLHDAGLIQNKIDMARALALPDSEKIIRILESYNRMWDV